MTTDQQQGEDMPRGDWQMDMKPLPIQARFNDTAQAVSLLVIQNMDNGDVIWSMLWGENTTQDEVVTLVAAQIQEMLEKEKHLQRIFLDTSSFFKRLGEQLAALASKHHLPIEVVYSLPHRPRGKGRIEASFKRTTDWIEQMPGFIEYRRGKNTKVDAGNLLTLSELEQRMTDFVKNWNQSQ